ncbi:MAG TPA: extracellular solute-binding protein, partial [Propionibacteriaceae bacterium]|nr:extracellular solute-binding protein [Propionibacteriaceae bacterium]
MTLSRRTILGTSAALAAASAAGCSGSATAGGAGASGGASAGPVTLRFTWWGNDLRNKLTNQVIELFMQKHPTIKIAPEPTEWNAYWDKLATQVAGGNAPDVIQHDESQIAAYGSRGNLLELTTQKVLDLSTMDAKVLDTGKVGGKVYGAPVGIAVFSVAVNP